MTENTKIEWATHTFNAWEGCTKVGPGCDNCYAATRDNRLHGGSHWGPGAPRRHTSEAYWRQPLKWEREAVATGVRPRVFCNSLADVFDNEVDPAWRAELFAMIRRTPHLDWLILTKRIGNVSKMLPKDWGIGYPNVWLISTVVNQEEAARDVPKLMCVPAVLRGLSVEPMLGPVNLKELWVDDDPDQSMNALVGIAAHSDGRASFFNGLGWVIIGGESGRGARAFQMGHARALLLDCQRNNVPVFMKQMGAHPYDGRGEIYFKHRKGGDPTEWPEELRVREFPDTALPVN